MGKLNLEACKNTEKAQDSCAFSLFEVVSRWLLAFGRWLFDVQTFKSSNFKPSNGVSLGAVRRTRHRKKKKLSGFFLFCYLYQTNGIRR